MDTKIKDIEVPAILIKDIILDNNKIIVTLTWDRKLDYNFNDFQSAEKIYKNIVEKMKRKMKIY